MQITNYLTKQKMMRTVLWSLLPIYLFSIYLFGWRILLVLAVALISTFLGELFIMRMINGDKAKVSEAALVTAALLSLSLPPGIKLWMVAVGALFGIIFGKAIFGGFAKNVFNPALVGRAFIFVNFPAEMTNTWQIPFSGFPGGFAKWSGTADMVTAVTPMIDLKLNGTPTNPLQLFLGTIPGSAGETSALLILLAAAYLIYTKTASWKIMLATAVSGMGFTLLFQALGGTTQDPLFAILSGGFLFGTVFMTTDPVSAPTKDPSKIIYGVLIGFCTAVIRSYSLFSEGITFAILIANSFAPLIDRTVKNQMEKRKAKLEAPVAGIKEA